MTSTFQALFQDANVICAQEFIQFARWDPSAFPLKPVFNFYRPWNQEPGGTELSSGSVAPSWDLGVCYRLNALFPQNS